MASASRYCVTGQSQQNTSLEWELALTQIACILAPVYCRLQRSLSHQQIPTCKKKNRINMARFSFSGKQRETADSSGTMYYYVIA